MRKDNGEAYEEVQARFIDGRHLNNLENIMKKEKLLVTFRAAGKYTLEKLRNGAAAKPHSVLDKSIKPQELDIEDCDMNLDSIVMGKLSRDEKTKIARRFLCGIVGIRTDDGNLIGVYLSKEGMEKYSKTHGENVAVGDTTQRPYIKFNSKEELVDWIRDSVIDTTNKILDYSKYFMTGDYDIHEIQKKDTDKFVHIECDSVEEFEILNKLSLGSMGSEVVDVPDEFHPMEHSPIQHGAQDNYLTYMYKNENNSKLVSKVILPDNDLAIYNGDTCKWTVLTSNSDGTDEVSMQKALFAQIKELKGYYTEIKAQLPFQWDLIDDTQLQVWLMELYGKTPKEVDSCDMV